MDKGTAIKIRYGMVPHYCKFCLKLGHLDSNCLAKEKEVAAPSRNVEQVSTQ